MASPRLVTTVPSRGPEFLIQHRWKEQVAYWEGERGFVFDAAWGVTPPILYVPSPDVWAEVVPTWLRGRRDQVVRRLRRRSGHVLEETDAGYDPATSAWRCLAGGP